MAGFVAQQLADWDYWDAATEYAALRPTAVPASIILPPNCAASEIAFRRHRVDRLNKFLAHYGPRSICYFAAISDSHFATHRHDGERLLGNTR